MIRIGRYEKFFIRIIPMFTDILFFTFPIVVQTTEYSSVKLEFVPYQLQ